MTRARSLFRCIAVLWALALPLTGASGNELGNLGEDALMAEGPLRDLALGAPTAPITVIEYGSLSCMHCAEFNKSIFPAFKAEYIDPGKVRYILRPFPLNPADAMAFGLARCGGRGEYYDLVDELFDQRYAWISARDPRPALRKLARKAGFTPEEIDACMQNGRIRRGITWIQERAANLFGVSGTPTFFVNGQRHVGAPTWREFKYWLVKAADGNDPCVSDFSGAASPGAPVPVPPYCPPISR